MSNVKKNDDFVRVDPVSMHTFVGDIATPAHDTNKSQLNMKRCINGHLYDANKNEKCPYCDGTIKLVKCQNGHTYNGNRYMQCPHCVDELELFPMGTYSLETEQFEHEKRGEAETATFDPQKNFLVPVYGSPLNMGISMPDEEGRAEGNRNPKQKKKNNTGFWLALTIGIATAVLIGILIVLLLNEGLI